MGAVPGKVIRSVLTVTGLVVVATIGLSIANPGTPLPGDATKPFHSCQQIQIQRPMHSFEGYLTRPGILPGDSVVPFLVSLRVTDVEKGRTVIMGGQTILLTPSGEKIEFGCSNSICATVLWTASGESFRGTPCHPKSVWMELQELYKQATPLPEPARE